MKTCKKCGAVKSISEFAKQKDCKGGVRSECKECMAAKTKAWRENDPERAKASVAAVREKNPDRWKELDRKRGKKYRENNPEQYKATRHRYIQSNPGKGREWYLKNSDSVKARVKLWAQSNPEKVKINALTGVNRRRARKAQATPGWADHAQIRAIYQERERIQADSGVAHHVDHVIPLKSKLVCGLHVAENLRVVTAKMNLKKGNSFSLEELT